MPELTANAALVRIEAHLAQLAVEGPKNAVIMATITAELATIKDQVASIKKTVTGEDGGNGLRMDVRDLLSRMDAIESRNTTIADWGWKVLMALTAAVFALPALIAQLRDLIKD